MLQNGGFYTYLGIQIALVRVVSTVAFTFVGATPAELFLEIIAEPNARSVDA
jgi:hypothetical protein